VLERAAGMGYAVNAAAEYEFFLFEETPQSIREKGYRQLKTMTPGAFGYSVLRSSVHSACTTSCWISARPCAFRSRACIPRRARRARSRA